MERLITSRLKEFVNKRVVCSVSGIVARIEQVGERAVKGISTVLHDFGEIILHEAKLNAPRDTGDLESSLHAEAMRNGINGRLWIKITIFPDVADYAWLMEEFLTPHGSGGYSARPGTRAKGPQAGGKYIERAVEKYRSALIRRANEVAKRVAKR